MSKVKAGITTSVDGYVTGPDDGWAAAAGEDKKWLDTPDVSRF